MSNQNLDSGFAGSSSPVGAGGPTTSSVPPTFLGGVDRSNSPLPSLQKLTDALSYNYEYPELNDSCRRQEALDLLSKNREICADLGPLLWNSVGTIFTLLEEVMSAYRVLSSPDRIARILPNLITRVCNALVLLRCIASHPKTRKQFIDANIPLYLYHFLGTISSEKHIEIWRLTSLGVISALVKENDTEVTHFLLKSEVFPYCLRCMEFGHDLSKAVATYIIQRILMHEEGLKYCCSSTELFFVVGSVLGNMVETLA